MFSIWSERLNHAYTYISSFNTIFWFRFSRGFIISLWLPLIGRQTDGRILFSWIGSFSKCYSTCLYVKDVGSHLITSNCAFINIETLFASQIMSSAIVFRYCFYAKFRYARATTDVTRLITQFFHHNVLSYHNPRCEQWFQLCAMVVCYKIPKPAKYADMYILLINCDYFVDRRLLYDTDASSASKIGGGHITPDIWHLLRIKLPR